MAVVRLRLGGRDWGDLQQLPFAPRPSRDPLGLKRPLLDLLAENIAVNSSAALEQSRDAPGAFLRARICWKRDFLKPPIGGSRVVQCRTCRHDWVTVVADHWLA